ncbi:MAG: hypothetical protein E7539_05520 [Ruminococcaceae bacterium]|nr:hypothetical protein [Oscillospiraceae bacterium]
MKKLLLVLFSVLFIAVFGLTCFANSGQTSWQGSSNAGTVIFDKDCPIEVEKEKLVFDIPEFPSTYYESSEDFLDYSASVTAQYTFKNPADYDVTATLAFPFGVLPSYTYFDDFAIDFEKYDVTVNGGKIGKKQRHTLFTGYEYFDYKEEGKKLRDSYVEDDFFSPDLPVKVYVYEVNGIDDSLFSAYISASFSEDGEKTRIMVSDCWGHEYKNNKVHTGLNVENKSSVYVYAIGEDIKNLPEWKMYHDSSKEVQVEGGSVDLLFTDDRTFKDIATMFHLEETTNVTEVDWYNATVDYLNSQTFDEFFLGSDIDIKFTPYNFMRWYEYEIEIGAGEKLLNTVTAPLYPTINEGYEPAVYEYNYLLSPAKSWSSFKDLDIEINTPFYLINSNLGGFEKDVESYTLFLNSLPKDELNFTLCSEKDPEEIRIPIYVPYEILVLAVIIMAAIILVLVIVVIVLIVKRKKK